MLPDRVSNPGPLTYESGTLPIALRGPAKGVRIIQNVETKISINMHGQTAYRWFESSLFDIFSHAMPPDIWSIQTG